MVTTMIALPPPVGVFSEKQFSSISKTLREYLGLLSWTWINGRYITLLTKICIVKAMVFPVVTYGLESWTMKKAEHQRIDAFKLWCWRRLLRVPWTARRSN